MWYEDTIEELLVKAKQRNLKPDNLLIGPICVCQSGAGYYIGSWCVENVEGTMLPQPYERVSEYFGTKEAALAALPHYKD